MTYSPRTSTTAEGAAADLGLRVILKSRIYDGVEAMALLQHRIGPAAVRDFDVLPRTS